MERSSALEKFAYLFFLGLDVDLLGADDDDRLELDVDEGGFLALN